MHACNLGIFLVVIAEGILLLARNLYHQLSLEESLQVTYLKLAINQRDQLQSKEVDAQVPPYDRWGAELPTVEG